MGLRAIWIVSVVCYLGLLRIVEGLTCTQEIMKLHGASEVTVFTRNLLGDGTSEVDIPIDCLEGLIEAGHFEQAEYLIMHYYLAKKIGSPTFTLPLTPH